MKKIYGKIALLSVIAVLFLGLSTASAASKPKINSIGSKTDSSVTLRIAYEKYASKKVDIVVSVRNKSNDTTTERTFEDEKLNSSGKKSLKIDTLLSSTKYSFKVKIKKHNGGSGYSGWSSSLSAKTKS